MPGRSNKGEKADFANFDAKNLLPWQRPLSDRKRSQSTIKYLPYGEKLVKIGQVDPEIICLKDLLFNEAVHADDPLKLRSYWTDLHQIYQQCSQIITDKLFKIIMAILQSISECQGHE